MGRNIFSGITGFHNVDLSISKSFKFGEKVKAQIRVETFNFLNHPNFANPYWEHKWLRPGGNWRSVTGWRLRLRLRHAGQRFFQSVLGLGQARAIQLGLKFSFSRR